MKYVTTISPRDREPRFVRARRIRLIFDAGLREFVSANSTRIRTDIPRPHRHTVPIFQFETILRYGFF